MKRIAVIGLAVVLVLFPTLAMNCGGGGDSENLDIKNPEGKIKWIETQPLVCSYSQDRSADEAYGVSVGGELERVTNDTVTVFSVIIRLYNSSGEVVSDMIDDYAWKDGFSFSTYSHWDWSFTVYYAQEVVRYDVFVTDSQGNEYICLRD